MNALLYAIGARDAFARNPETIGIDGRPLRAVQQGDLAALVGDCSAQPAATEAELMAFDRVMQRLMVRTPVLPARFGTAVDSDGQIERVLDERRTDFTDALARVAGAVELAVRATWAGDRQATSTSRAESGTAYMRRRLGRHRQVDQIKHELEDALGGVSRASRYATRTDPAVEVKASYLVADVNVDEFLARLDRCEQTTSEFTFVCTGPWPPYSFTGSQAR